MVADIKALLQGVQTCVDRGFLNVDIEVDSLILTDVVQLKIPAPWCIIYDIRSLMSLLNLCNFSVSDTNKENNMVADFLSNNVGCKEGKF